MTSAPSGSVRGLRIQTGDPVLDTERFQNSRIPPYAIALLESLQFSGANRKGLEVLGDSEWTKLLALCDASQLTLLLGHFCRPFLPDWVRARIDRNYSDNADRFDRLSAAVFEISDCLRDQSIDFALLKGFAHSPDLTPDPLLRAQGDIDIWCLPDRILEAKNALSDLGYRAISKSKGRHLDPMVRDTDWEWRGDYFAPDLPIPVDLHYQLWDAEMEYIPGPQENEFWVRRCSALIGNRKIPVLASADAVAFAALHVMMHLLHGDVRLQRVWELAYVLENRSRDEQFWLHWQSLYSPEIRQLQVTAFLLSERWFGCALPDLIIEEAARISPDVSLWIRQYGLSPVEALFVPNKAELWLNLCFLNSFSDKARVFSRRLLPLSAAKQNATTRSKQDPRKAKNEFLRAKFLMRRAAVHAFTLPSTCIHGLKWWWLRQRLGRDFLVFLLSSVLFDFGEFIFFLLYNLYLIDRGYTEKFLGQVTAAVTAGTFLAVLPAAAIARRIGLKKTVMIAILGTATATTLRAVVHWPPGLLVSAFLNGLFMSFWAVSMPPAVAGLTSDRNRTLGFSLITSMGIGIGALAGLIGGRLPATFLHFSPSLTAAGSKQMALLAGSGLAALAIFPAILLRFPVIEETEKKKTYPRSRFVYVFLLALFVWSIGTGGFNPFFNVYFSRHLHVSVERIGFIFSSGQIAQVAVILFAPVIMRKLGELRSIAGMQLATAAMLGLLAVVSNPVLGAVAYIAYMCFQYMSEPCLLSMLMSRVDPSEQSGASALNFLIIALAGIFASLVAGPLFTRLGYGFTLTACATVTLAAAGLFYRLVRR
jgi:predicted MFS family arabinose efflux permease